VCATKISIPGFFSVTYASLDLQSQRNRGRAGIAIYWTNFGVEAVGIAFHACFIRLFRAAATDTNRSDINHLRSGAAAACRLFFQDKFAKLSHLHCSNLQLPLCAASFYCHFWYPFDTYSKIRQLNIKNYRNISGNHSKTSHNLW